jgi:PAS domain S-box-containing protein
LENALENLSFISIADAMVDAIIILDNAGKVVLSNKPAQQALGYKAQEIVGMTINHIIPGANCQSLKKHKDVNKPMQYDANGNQWLAISKDSQEIAVEISFKAIEVEANALCLIVFCPIDTQIAAEQTLKASEERLKLAKSSAGLGVFDINLSLNIVEYDELVAKIFGFMSKEIINYDAFRETIMLDDQASWNALLKPAKKLESEYTIEFRVKNRMSHEEHWIHVAGKVFFNDKTAVRVLGLMRDITEKKRLQQKISQQSIDLETLAKTQIAIQTASAIAHEINQPLAAISAYSEVALYALKAEHLDTDRLSRSLSGCVTQAQRAGKSLHELMDFLQKGKIESSPIDLNEVVHEAISITRHTGYGGFQTVLNLDPELPKVLANRTQIQKVLVNLIRNGVEAVRSIGVPVAKIKVNVRTHEELNMAEVVIQDNGPGLTKEAVGRIFEPFFTTKPHGIGMGLAISRTLVEACGGQLWFDSNVEEGATFHLTLPFVSH